MEINCPACKALLDVLGKGKVYFEFRQVTCVECGHEFTINRRFKSDVVIADDDTDVEGRNDG